MIKRIFGLAVARFLSIVPARNSSRRWTIDTDLAYRVRKIASSRALSPPPTTTRSFSLKKQPSQVAQYETPRPVNSF